MKLFEKVLFTFIMMNLSVAKYEENNEEDIRKLEQNFGKTFRFLAEQKNYSEVAEVLTQILQNYFLQEVDSKNVADLLEQLKHVELQEFSESQQEELSETIRKGIHSVMDSTGDISEQLNALFEKVKPVYIRKYLSNLKDAIQNHSKLDLDFDFNKLVHQHISNIKTSDKSKLEEVQQICFTFNDNHKRFVKNVLFPAYVFYAKIQDSHHSQFHHLALISLINYTRNNNEEGLLMFKDVIKTILGESREQEFVGTFLQKHLEQSLLLEKNFFLNNERNTESIDLLVQTYL